MAKYRKISPCIWNDARVRELSDKAKLALLFMLTHPYMTPLGAIRANFPGLAFELGWSAGAFRKAFAEILAQGIAQSDEKASLIWFPKFLKHNLPESPNVVRSWPVWFEDLPESPLKQVILGATAKMVERIGEGFKTALREAFPEAFPEAFAQGFAKGMPNQEQEQEEERENTASAPPLASPAAEHTFALSHSGKGEEAPSAPESSPEPSPEPEPAGRRGKRQQAPPDGEAGYQAKSGRWLSGKRLAAFERFWGAFALAKGKAEAADAWCDIPELTDVLVAHICRAASLEAHQRADDMAKGKSPKWAQGWLSSRRWEDYPATAGCAPPVTPATPVWTPSPEEQAANRERGLRHVQAMREHGILPGGPNATGPKRADFSAPLRVAGGGA